MVIDAKYLNMISRNVATVIAKLRPFTTRQDVLFTMRDQLHGGPVTICIAQTHLERTDGQGIVRANPKGELGVCTPVLRLGIGA